MNEIKILIAVHKEGPLPKNEIYLPIQVGRKISTIKLDMQGDDEGENISEKNPLYCELTAMYWAWKNLKTDIIGLCHYRRYFKFYNNDLFSKKIYQIPSTDIDKCIPNKKEIEQLLNVYDIIMSKPDIFPFPLGVQYCYSHNSEDLKILAIILNEMYPNYSTTWKLILLYNNKLEPYNMFICRAKLFNDYCTWLFPMLKELEKRIKLSPYLNPQRVIGFLAERLFLLYMKHNKLKIKHIPIQFIQDTGAIDNSSIVSDKLINFKNNLSFYIGNTEALLKKITH